MKLIEQKAELLIQPEGLEGMYKQIENAARICYKSENNSTGDSKSFVDKLIKMKHFSVLEHGTVYLKMFWPGSVCDLCNQTEEDEHIDKYLTNPYSKVVYHGNDVYVTTNYRCLIENNWLDDLKYLCKPTEFHPKRLTFKLTTSISIVRELIRHRAFSFANESTRYCDYSNKSKFSEGNIFIMPYWFADSTEEQGELFMDYCKYCEDAYTTLLGKWDNKKPDKRFKTGFKENPLPPQAAREVLPLCTKSELVMTGFEDDWNNFLDIRLRGTTGKPHPDMVELAQLIENEIKKEKQKHQ